MTRLLLGLALTLPACREKDGDIDSGSVGTDDSSETTPVDADQDGVPADEDCDDLNNSVYPGNTETPYNGVDDDCDPSTPDDDLDADGYGADEDCDDEDAALNPGAVELCDGLDNDCNGLIDDAAGDTWYADVDGDGYGDPNTATQSCEGATGFVADSNDCDDLQAQANPGQSEVCDEIDNNCDGQTDEGVTTTWYQDADQDGHGTGAVTAEACDAPSGYAATDTDCDDSDPAVSPNAIELCNAIDDDCDGAIDEADAADATEWYSDADSDGYGDPGSPVVACDAPSGAVASDSDCDDVDPAVNPGAAEVCDGLDNDCDGDIDQDATDADTWHLDFDGDGYGGATYTLIECDQPSGYVLSGDDCDDAEAAVNPGAVEACNNIDDDCDGTVDDGAPYGQGESCPGVDCLDILTVDTSAADGTYWIDPDSAGAFQVRCDMSTDGGGWTMVGSFNNNDGNYSWTRYASGTDNLGNWTNEATFGSLGAYDSADYKSPAFWRVAASDLLALDDGGGWASYDSSLGGTLRDEVASYSSCQTSFASGVSVDSNDSIIASAGQLTWFGGDPNNSSLCPLNYQVNSTDSSVIGMAQQGCGTAGFGHVGYYNGANHYDRDHYFCLQGTMQLNTATACGAWYGSTAAHWFNDTACSYATLYVR